MGQTNAPAGSEWVDQFNRAVQYGQINVAPLGLPQHASTHAIGGSDAVSAASIGAASTTHASTHATGGSDIITPASIGASVVPVTRSGFTFAATGNTTAEVLQGVYAFPGGCLGPNGYIEGTIFVNCTASANTKTLRAYISSTNVGLSGTRFVSYVVSSSTSVVGMRQFILWNRGSQTSQIAFPAASGGVGSNTSTNAYEELTFDTSVDFYISVGVLKTLGTDTLQTKAIILRAVYQA